MNLSDGPGDWRQGYATAVDYTAGHYPNLYPEHLNHACLLHGVEPPTLERRYTYFELGCGHAGTVSVLAASNPQARFFANDFMPSHVAAGRDRAGRAGLDNLTLLEHSFGDLAAGTPDLPELDYITMQGVYTWVSVEVRREIVRFIGRRLKPGGVVCLGYNAMPGWAGSLPAHRWMQASAQWAVSGGAERVDHARTWLQRLSDAQAEVFADSPAMTRRLAQISEANPAYLHHEYLNRHWQPMYHADVAAELADAKLDFVGSAMLPSYWMRFPPAQQALLDAIPDPTWRETAKDYLLASSFRTDIFVKGRRTMAPARRRALLAGSSVALTARPETAAAGLARTDAALAAQLRPTLEVMAQQPHRFAEFAGPDSFDGAEDPLLPLIAMLSMNRHASVYRDAEASTDGRAARAWNACIAADAALGGSCTALASPVTGGGVDTDAVGLAVYRHLSDGGAGDVDAVLRAWQPAGPGAAPPDRARVQQVLAQDLPWWRRMGVL